MFIREIDFGPIDARHAFSTEAGDTLEFSKIYINPLGINLDDYILGKKCFVYGIKGVGKSAFLRHIKQAIQHKSLTSFIYFSEIMPNKKAIREGYENVQESALSEQGMKPEFWRTFLLLAIAREIARNFSGSAARKFLKYMAESTTGGNPSIFGNIISAVPKLQSWATQINLPSTSVRLEGEFASVNSIGHFFDSALSLLRDVNIQRPVYIFIDELEIKFSASEAFSADIATAAALVSEIRNLNEYFRSNSVNVFIVCAIRKEVSQRILGKDASKIVRDLGYEITWQRPAWSEKYSNYYHPLFQIVLRRIFFSQNPNKNSPSWEELRQLESQYFNFKDDKWSQKWLLDLTTYRPRDLPILFSAAKQHDGPKSTFSRETFSRLIRVRYRQELWSDFAEALRAEYSDKEVETFRKIFFSLPNFFRLPDFMEKADDFSADPEVAEMIEITTPKKWAQVLKDLYELGAVGYSSVENDEERVHFHFRGNTEGLQITRKDFIVKQLGLRHI